MKQNISKQNKGGDLRNTQDAKSIRKDYIMSAKNRFTVNFFKRTISGTQTSFDKANKGFGPAYEELTAKVARHKGFELVIEGSAKAKRTYNGMDFDFMEAYISIQKNAEQIMAEYESIKKEATDSGISVYPFTKKWFLGEFDPNKNGFDMDKAKKEISNCRIAKAVLSANSTPAEENEDQTAKQDNAA